MQLDDVRAIVTGAASGLGRRFATELVQAGATVIAGDIDTAGLEALRCDCRDAAGVLITDRVDISREDSVGNFVRQAFHRTSDINVLVNNAGILRDGLLVKDESGWVRALPRPQWSHVIAVNLTGAYLMARDTVAEMVGRKTVPAVVVNVSSMMRFGSIGQSGYVASKAGLDACTRTWALELASHGIRVGGIAPGLVDTPMLGEISPDALQALVTRTPLQRVGTVAEVWLALKFILECDYFTGRVIEVDGGGLA